MTSKVLTVVKDSQFTGGTRRDGDEKHPTDSSFDLEEPRDLQQLSEKVKGVFLFIVQSSIEFLFLPL